MNKRLQKQKNSDNVQTRDSTLDTQYLDQDTKELLSDTKKIIQIPDTMTQTQILIQILMGAERKNLVKH